MALLQATRPFKSRKPHTKSRNGCNYCRRRRIKCDESRPSCSNCTSRNQPCEYVGHLQHDAEVRSEEVSDPSTLSDSSTQGLFSVLLDTTPASSTSSLYQAPAYYNSGSRASTNEQLRQDAESISPLSAKSDGMSESEISLTNHLFLFDHYMSHACRHMDPIAVYAWKVGIPRLGAEHTAVLGSIMAFGAACLCLDLLLDQGPSEHPGDADELIKTGDRYHQLGLQSVQRQMMLNQPKDITEAYAHSMLLFPYAMAREKISDLIGKRSPSGPSTGLHIESPGHLDWAIVLRGISTTGRAYRAVNSNETDGAINDGMDCQSQKLHHSIASHILAKVSELGGEPGTAGPEPKPILASKHALFPVVSATRVVALETLQRKLESLDQTMRDRHRNAVPAMDGDKVLIRLAQTQSITACSIAVDLLFYLCKMIFDLEQDDISSQPNSCVVDTRLDSFQWLRDYARRGIYSHGGPAYRTIFSWVSTTPDEYFELLKEPIPAQQTRSAAASARQEPAVSWDVEREIRLLAWDIWAHWLVFAILIEHETFWTPNFGTKDITSLAPLFQGSAATPTLGPSKAEAQDWWPGNMCSIALQLQKYNSRGLA